MEKKHGISIIVPVYNEQEGVKQVLISLLSYLSSNNVDDFEIIVVNDGSEDNTSQVLSDINLKNIKVINQPYNKGYGSTLKLGVSVAKKDLVLFFDGDGQHRPEDVLNLINNIDNYDMVVGSREGYKGPIWRQPGKKIISIIANYLVKFKIPDLNSGLRIVKKEYFNKYIHLYPNGFSLSTTITLAFIKHGYSVKFIPITINKRLGKSSVKISDGFRAINLVIRMIMLFSPLRVFLPLGGFIFVLGMISFIYNLISINLTDTTVLLLLSSVTIVSFGFLADQVAAMRREINVKQ